MKRDRGWGRVVATVASCLAAAGVALVGLGGPVGSGERVAPREEVVAIVADAHDAGGRGDDSTAGSDDSAEPRVADAETTEAPYAPDVVLVRVADGVTSEETALALAGVDGLAAPVAAEEVAPGVMSVALAEDADVTAVADALAVAAPEVVAGAQPNYRYELADTRTEADLRALLATSEEVVAASDPSVAQTPSDMPATSVDVADDGASTSDDEAAAGDDNLAAGDGEAVANDVPSSAVDAASPAESNPLPDDAAAADASALDVADVPTASAPPAESSSLAPASDATGAAALLASVSPVTINDPRSGEQWALASIRAYLAWALARGSADANGTPVTIAVLDQGFNINHVDLRGNVVAPYAVETGGATATDLAGNTPIHGTKVAGIASATVDNGFGVAGVSYNAQIMPVRVSRSSGGIFTADLAAGYAYVMRQAAAHNVRVVNVSIAAARPFVETVNGVEVTHDTNKDEVLMRAIDAADAAGIVTVAAAGNGSLVKTSGDIPFASYPGDYDPVVSVINLRAYNGGVVRSGSVGEGRSVASNYNRPDEQSKNVSAPGTSILCTTSDGSYGYDTGTSMAAPCVAGVLALEFAACPRLTAAEAREILYDTALDLGPTGFDSEYGHGEVDAAAAVAAAALRRREQGPSVAYRTHVQHDGWQGLVRDGATSGTSGRSLRLEALEVSLENQSYEGGVEYRSHVQTYGWQGWVANGTASGTSNESKRLEAVQVRLTGEMAERYDVWYRVHAQTYGWLGWAKNGATAGTAGLSKRLEAIKIAIVPKGSAAPDDGVKTSYGALVAQLVGYRVHVQDHGWQGWVADGVAAGTTGQSKRLEAIELTVPAATLGYAGGITYRTHVQTYGWERTWVANGARSGTEGQSKRLEAIEIRLTGELATRYDVWYRVHAQEFGWLGWASNGASAGTAGYSYRLEAIEVKLVEKGGAAPGATAVPFRKASSSG